MESFRRRFDWTAFDGSTEPRGNLVWNERHKQPIG